MKIEIIWGFNLAELEDMVNKWLNTNKDKVILSVGEAYSSTGNGFHLRIFYSEVNNVFETPPAVQSKTKSDQKLEAALETLTIISKAHEEGWSRDVAKSALKKISEMGE
jgi:hypothetical protein